MSAIIIPSASAAGRSIKVARVLGTISALPADRPWRIEIVPYKPRRSNQQNAYLWGVCYPEIMKHLDGWHAEDVHDYFLGECFGWEELEGMGRKRIRPLRRSSKLNKQEFSDYIAFVQHKAAEMGIVIPDPEYPEP